MQIRVRQERAGDIGRIARIALREPFTARSWRELGYFLATAALTTAAVILLAGLALAGFASTVVLIGVGVLAVALRAARRLGGAQRALAEAVLEEPIAAPPARPSRPGLFGWLRASFSDRAAWGAVGYFALKVPLLLFGSWSALGIWVEALLAVASPLTGRTAGGNFGLAGRLFGAYDGPSPAGRLAFHAGVFVTGVVLLVIAPWTMRLVVGVDRWLMHLLLGPGASASRVQTLEESRSRTIDAATARLRRIERDLHDGTQAQLVALAMRLGQAREELDQLAAGPAGPDIEAVRRLVEDAHRGAKEAITDLRDLARGIHPPALDTGLENALSTLAARSSVPTAVSVSIPERPAPAIEAIGYFCAAELLANVAQHSGATRASLTCAQHGPWLRIVVRDDGSGGAAPGPAQEAPGGGAAPGGSSGLAGLADRVAAVDGHLSIASPPGGPTAITVDLPHRS